jgi:hypothetical protein
MQRKLDFREKYIDGLMEKYEVVIEEPAETEDAGLATVAL